jgi:hypothetical protein
MWKKHPLNRKISRSKKKPLKAMMPPQAMFCVMTGTNLMIAFARTSIS